MLQIILNLSLLNTIVKNEVTYGGKGSHKANIYDNCHAKLDVGMWKSILLEKYLYFQKI